MAESEFQGTSSSSELYIETESPRGIQEDQFLLSGVSDEAAISKTAATDNPVEPEHEEDEVSI